MISVTGLSDDIPLTFNIVGHSLQKSAAVRRLAVVANNETVVRGCRSTRASRP